MTETSEIRNIGLVAHVDSGKTTVTENMLYLSGRIRSLGKVDDGTTQTDWLDVERQRGISVRAATTAFTWRDCAINLIDTPGHIDFSAEVERTLRVLDGAVLIVSAVEGVQSHTETIWHTLRQLDIPTVIFVNKLDRIGADGARVLSEIRRILSPHAVPVAAPIGSEAEFAGCQRITDQRSRISGQPAADIEAWRDMLVETLAEVDDEILEQYLSGAQIADTLIDSRLAALSRRGIEFPVLFGAAKNSLGISELLDGVLEYLPPAPQQLDGPVAGVVFKVQRDESVGRLTYVRLFSGCIKPRDMVTNTTNGVQEKAALIRRMYARKHEDVQLLRAGDICALVGLNEARVGDILGDPALVRKGATMCVPLLSVQVMSKKPEDYTKLVDALHTLDDEDPMLNLQWVQETREMTIDVMGTIQVEVLKEILQTRFELDTVFGPPTIIYKETPATASEGFVAYTMPKPCWAILKFFIEPGPRGSGLVYRTEKIRSEDMQIAYQNEVARRVPEALKQGLNGWEVTDLKVTLVDGEHHIFHTHPLDWAVATPMGIMNGLANCGTILLEPILQFRISVPEEAGGKVLGDLSQMRGTFDPPQVMGDRMIIEGEVPLETSIDYSARLSSLTKGRGHMSARFLRYSEAPAGTTAIRQRRGIDPRDTAKYILWARHALA